MTLDGQGSTITQPDRWLYLKGSIGFDSDGRSVLTNTKGKVFQMDDNIKSQWTCVEIILARPGIKVKTLQELMDKMPLSKKDSNTPGLLTKFVELDLIGIKEA